jgi:YD repeat-containing protein
VMRVTDPLGRSATLTRDGRGELASLSLPSAGTVTATRDTGGAISSIQYPGGASWQYDRDASGLLSEVTDPLGRATTATRDGRGRVSGIALPGGLGTATLAWSDAGKLTDVDLSDGTALDYGYDAAGRLSSAGTATFGWDDAGRMVDSDGLAIGRDAAGRIDSVTYAPGKTVTYVYDARGLLATVTDWLGGVTSFTYDSAARLVAIARPNGLTTRYTYDEDSRLVRIAEVEDAPLQGETERASIAVTYLPNDAIAAVDVVPALSALPQIAAVQRTFDAAGQVSGSQYDARGLLLGDGVGTYDWDLAGRLTSATIGADTYAIGWDDLNHIEVVNGPVGAIYGRNHAAGAIAVVLKDDLAQDEQYVVTTPAGGVIYAIDAATDARSYYHHDERFSTRFLSDDWGWFTDHYQYDPQGFVLDHSGSSTQPFTYLGHYGVQQLGSTALFHHGTWIYDATSGLTLNPDWARPADPRAANPYLPFGTATRPFAPGSTAAVLPRFDDLEPADGFSEIPERSSLLRRYLSDGIGFRAGFPLAYSRQSAFDSVADVAPQSADAVEWTQGLNGFVLSKCDFQLAHGYAFLSDSASQRLAAGYVARLLDDGSAPLQSDAAATDPDENRRQVIEKFRAKYPVQPLRRPWMMLNANLARVQLWIALVSLTSFGDSLRLADFGALWQAPLMQYTLQHMIVQVLARSFHATASAGWSLGDFWVTTVAMLLWYRLHPWPLSGYPGEYEY